MYYIPCEVYHQQLPARKRNVKHFRYLVETPGRDPRRRVGDVELCIVRPIIAYLVHRVDAHEDDGTNISIDVIFIESHIHP